LTNIQYSVNDVDFQEQYNLLHVNCWTSH